MNKGGGDEILRKPFVYAHEDFEIRASSQVRAQPIHWAAKMAAEDHQMDRCPALLANHWFKSYSFEQQIKQHERLAQTIEHIDRTQYQ